MKRVSTPCAVHPDCVLRVTTDDDGNDSVEHSSVIEAHELAARELARVKDVEQARGFLTSLSKEQDRASGLLSKLEDTTSDLHSRLSRAEHVLSEGIGHELGAAKEAQRKFERITNGLEQRFSDLRDLVEATLRDQRVALDEFGASLRELRVLVDRAESTASQLNVRFEDFTAKNVSEIAKLKAEVLKASSDDAKKLVDEVAARILEQISLKIGG